jgi:hypothetical protein
MFKPLAGNYQRSRFVSRRILWIVIVVMGVGLHAGVVWADEDRDESTQPAGRYFFGLLDSRSSFGKDFFPDPFLGPDFDAETQLEIDYLHAEKANIQADEVDAGFQWNVAGQLTVSADFGWDRESAGDAGDPSGFENVDLGVYHPLFQYVSNDDFFDYTAVGRLDAGIPTRTAVSGKDLQLSPYLGQLLRIGRHFSVQAWTGAQFTLAPGPSNDDAFAYGTLLGWRVGHNELPLPLIDSVTPLLELDGSRPFVAADGQDALSGIAGANFNFKSIGEAQPALNIGWQFPIDQGARSQFRWGVIAEFFLQF